MSAPLLDLFLPDAEASARLAARLAPRLGPGDTLLLEGPIGAGKSHFVRAAIHARMRAAGTIEEVPSPTFTLVQTYELPSGEIWHADLYRLGGPGEIEDLGLLEAFGAALVFVEWPDRLGPEAPPEALRLRLCAEAQGRRLVAEGPEPWRARLAELGDG